MTDQRTIVSVSPFTRKGRRVWCEVWNLVKKSEDCKKNAYPHHPFSAPPLACSLLTQVYAAMSGEEKLYGKVFGVSGPGAFSILPTLAAPTVLIRHASIKWNPVWISRLFITHPLPTPPLVGPCIPSHGRALIGGLPNHAYFDQCFLRRAAPSPRPSAPSLDSHPCLTNFEGHFFFFNLGQSSPC